jgi:hypothetical protein
MSGVSVSLEVLAIALRLMAWFGMRACDARVPFFYVKPTSVAVVPIRKMFGGVRVWRSWWLAILCYHMIVWWRDVAKRWVVAGGSVGQWCVAPSSTLVAFSCLVLHFVDCRLCRSSFGCSVACVEGRVYMPGCEVAGEVVVPFVLDGERVACCMLV